MRIAAFLIVAAIVVCFPPSASAAIYDECTDFATREIAQDALDDYLNDEDWRETLEAMGEDVDAIIAAMDADQDGIACEADEVFSGEVTSSSQPWTISSPAFEFELLGATIVEQATGEVSLPALDDGRVWLLVTYSVESTHDEPFDFQSESITILSEGQEIRQAGAETRAVAGSLDLDAPAVELDPGERKKLVQVYKVSPSTGEHMLKVWSHGEWMLDLGPVIAATGDQIAAILPESATDISSAGESDSAQSFPPTSAPQNTASQSTQPSQTSQVTVEELAYFEVLRADMERVTGPTAEFGALFTAAGNDPTLLFDGTWQIQVAALLVEWQQFDSDAQQMTPSARQLHIHDLWLAITELMRLSGDDIVLGVDNLDPDSLNRGSARITYATLLIEDLTAAIELFAEDPDASYTPIHAMSPVANCEPFPNYEEAQQYYAAHPWEQPTIDPDVDGLACEVYFGQG